MANPWLQKSVVIIFLVVQFVRVLHKDGLGLEFYSSGIGLSVISLWYATWHQFHTVHFVVFTASNKSRHLLRVLVLDRLQIVLVTITATRTVANEEAGIDDTHHMYSIQPGPVQPSPVDICGPKFSGLETASVGNIERDRWGIP